jgi:phage gpG-like protein
MRPFVSYRKKESGINDTKDKLQDVKRRSKNLEPVLTAAGISLRKYLASNYTGQGLLVGGWAPLDPKYAAWKAVNFPGTPPMVRTGALFNSVAVVGPEIDAHDNWATYTLKGVNYAKFHQYGTTKMPKRQIWFAPEVWQDELKDKIANYVMNGVLNVD